MHSLDPQVPAASDLARLQAQLAAVWERSDLLFSLLQPAAWPHRPIGLRHPFLFYLGHLSAFAWNQIGRGVLRRPALDAVLDSVFERGIDPADLQTAAAASAQPWPSLATVRAYVAEVRAQVTAVLPELSQHRDDLLAQHGRILHLVIEHEQMHHETLLYMLQACERALLLPELPGAARLADDGSPTRHSEQRVVAAGRVRLGIDFSTTDFGWDNEFGCAEQDLKAFAMDSLPVRNRDYLDFVLACERRGLGTPPLPQNWHASATERCVRTPLQCVPFDQAANWPVQVSGEAARAYCAYHGGRLPTEAEFHRAAFSDETGATRRYPWGDAEPSERYGTFDFSRWSPRPVGSTPASASAWGIEELCGNGWEWTSSPFCPLPGFHAYARTYPGYSADFFDGAHDVLLGGSWATARKLLRRSFRNWYRPSYPYVFSKFRLVRDS